jgi:hypothetical protein
MHVTATCSLKYNITYEDICSVSESSVGTGAGCFPSGAMVHTENGLRDISTITKGDRVLASDETGKLTYSEVCYISSHIGKVNHSRLAISLYNTFILFSKYTC